jgi:hypothetical protein
MKCVAGAMKTYGHDIKPWLAAKRQVHAVLVSLASGRAERFIEYGQLVRRITAIPTMEPDGNALREMLDQISREEDAAGHGMLTVLVVNKDTGRPGKGFFKTAKSLGRVSTSDEELWSNEFRRVREAWARTRGEKIEAEAP